MIRTRLFRSKRSQAVRLSKEVAFPEGVDEVTVIRDGARRIIVPSDSLWDEFFDARGIDIPDRDQPEMRRRESL